MSTGDSARAVTSSIYASPRASDAGYGPQPQRFDEQTLDRAPAPYRERRISGEPVIDGKETLCVFDGSAERHP